MPDLMTQSDSLLASVQNQTMSGPDWLTTIRKNAASSFERLGLPTRKHEDWKYTNLRRVAEMTYTPISSIPSHEIPNIESELVPEASVNLVFIDGDYVPALSTCSTTGPLTVTTLEQAIKSDTPEVKAHLANIADYDEEAITALNTALFTDGAVITIADGHVASQPIHVLNLSLIHI